MIAHYEDTKSNTLFQPIDKSQTRGFSGGAHLGLPKIEYKGN